MTELKNLHLQGGSMVNYAFEVFPMDATFHPIAALYVVTRQADTGNREHQVLFVGEAERMPDHLHDHPKAACFAKHGANCVGVHRLVDSAARREALEDLIGQFHPPCNG
jgi:hypothetical protein